jgi:hypothetical protein
LALSSGEDCLGFHRRLGAEAYQAFHVRVHEGETAFFSFVCNGEEIIVVKGLRQGTGDVEFRFEGVVIAGVDLVLRDRQGEFLAGQDDFQVGSMGVWHKLNRQKQAQFLAADAAPEADANVVRFGGSEHQKHVLISAIKRPLAFLSLAR